jgi:hypothetical protein
VIDVIFVLGREEQIIAQERWPAVPRDGDRVQIERDSMVRTFFVRGVTWKKGVALLHLSREERTRARHAGADRIDDMAQMREERR